MVIRRGEIWWAELSHPAGSGPGYRHPVVIVQSDDFNRSHINTVVAAVITSNIRLSEAPGNVFLPKKTCKLSKESVINISQIITLDKAFLSEKIGALPQELLAELEDGLRLVLSL
ncbi:MAG: type II toxin-antitoxin system PemK/MazF family toxin [Chitinivibrionales bacterium]|nr:type II toxin-antitoxin system PemK/MazF family toxin [Chitinivibrionales bacterium]